MSKEPWYVDLSEHEQNEYIESMCKGLNSKKLEKYAQNLRKRYGEYVNWSFHGKNGADSDNEKGFWRGMATSVLGFLNDLHKLGLIEKVGLYPSANAPDE